MSGIAKGLLSFSIVMTSLTLPAAETPPDMGAALTRLSAALERLSAATERQAEDRAGRKAEVAATILTLRARRIDRLESELRQVTQELEDYRAQLETMRDETNPLPPAENASPQELAAIKAMKTQMERLAREAETRMRTREERRLELQATLDREIKDAEGLEAILDDWLKQQR